MCVIECAQARLNTCMRVRLRTCTFVCWASYVSEHARSLMQVYVGEHTLVWHPLYLCILEVVRLLCCPEDVEHCKQCRGSKYKLCPDCRIPLCKGCADCTPPAFESKHSANNKTKLVISLKKVVQLGKWFCFCHNSHRSPVTSLHLSFQKLPKKKTQPLGG